MCDTENLLVQIKVDYHQFVGNLRVKGQIQNENLLVHLAIHQTEEEFDENDSEIETVARECIAATVAYILEWFGIPIDTEEAIRERDW